MFAAAAVAAAAALTAISTTQTSEPNQAFIGKYFVIFLFDFFIALRIFANF